MRGVMAGDSSKRERARVHFESSIVLTHDGRELAYQRTHDISMNGVYVLTAKPLPLGLEAGFELTLSVGMRQDVIKGRCEVVRVVSLDDGLSEEAPGPGMGLKFTEIEPDSSVTLYRIIRLNQPPE